MGGKKRRVWVSLYRYGEEGKFLVKTRSDCIRAWWIEKRDFFDWDVGEKKKVICYSRLNREEEHILNDVPKLYKTSWLALLMVHGISQKQVLDALKDKLSTKIIKVKTTDMWGKEREKTEEVVDLWQTKRIKFIVE